MISIRRILIHLCILHNIDFVFGNLTLELVQVLFRHGARTPIGEEIAFFPEYNESSYQPWGLSQLTTQGMIQEYQIGKMLRERYGSFLPDFYKAEDVYAYSSNTERTIASLQLVLAALYPPEAKQKWNDKLLWIPIPVHTIPRPLDILTNPRVCPMYSKKLQKVYDLESIKCSPHNSILRRISDISGKLMHYSEVFALYNLLKIHKSLNISLPQWYTDELYKNMEEASEFYLDILSYTNTLKRLNGGPFVRRFLENIISSNSNTEKRKIYLYSAHEKTLHAYMRSHNLTDFGNPDYGSVIIVEKYRSINNQYYIKLLYWTGDPKQMHERKLENCSEICPFEVYSEMVQSSLPSDDEMLCLLKNVGPKDLDTILNLDFKK